MSAQATMEVSRSPTPRVALLRLAHVTTADLSLRFLLLDQLRAFQDAGFDVLGISAPGPWADDLVRAGIPHAAVPGLERRWAPLGDLRALWGLVRVLARHRPHIVHTHTPKGRMLGRLAARLVGVPVVVNTFHGLYGLDGSWLRRRAFVWLERAGVRLGDFDLCQSREDLATLLRERITTPERSAYLGNGVDLSRFDPARVDRRAVRRRLGIADGALVVGTVGRLVWEKGFREFFAMAAALTAEDARVVPLIVGPVEAGKPDGIPSPVLEEVARRGRVRFLGLRTDMPDLYAAMDVFVLPSYREGFPRSAVEAAAMGRAMVLTDIRGCREVVQDGHNGFLVPPRDAAALTGRVRQLLGDPALRERFGVRSRAKALAEFDERRVVATTLRVYERLWEARRAGRGASVPR